jgi:hypothetical protein
MLADSSWRYSDVPMRLTRRMQIFVADSKNLTLAPAPKTTELFSVLCIFPSRIQAYNIELFQCYRQFFDNNKLQWNLKRFPCAAAHTADSLIKDFDTNQWTECSTILRENQLISSYSRKHQPPDYASNYKIFAYVSQFWFCLYSSQLVNPRHRKNDDDRATFCYIYKTLTDGPDSRTERCVMCALDCLWCCNRELVKPAVTLSSGIQG